MEGAIQGAFPMGNQTLALRGIAVSQEKVMKQLEKDKCSELAGADGINLKNLKEINCEMVEILMSFFHVQWLLLGTSKSFDSINLTFFSLQKRVCVSTYCLDGLACVFWVGRITRVWDVRKVNSVGLDQCGCCKGKPSVFKLTDRQRKWGKTDSQVKSWEKICSERLFASVKMSVVNRELNKSV